MFLFTSPIPKVVSPPVNIGHKNNSKLKKLISSWNGLLGACIDWQFLHDFWNFQNIPKFLFTKRFLWSWCLFISNLKKKNDRSKNFKIGPCIRKIESCTKCLKLMIFQNFHRSWSSQYLTLFSHSFRLKLFTYKWKGAEN